jgi:hypothetical protein
VEGSGYLSQFFELVLSCLDNFWVRMSLIGCGIPTQEIKVLSAFDVPHIDTFALCQSYREFFVVVSNILEVFLTD